MKLKAILSFCAILCASALFADNWTYFYSEEDSTYKVTDNVWTFKASVSDELLTVREVLDYPEEISMLDFSKPVTDADGNSYTIRTLSPQFAKNKNSWKEFEAKDAAKYVGELVLPPEGLKTISAGAFAACSNLTTVVNFIPDSVTNLGQAAFSNCVKLNSTLTCRNVSYLDRKVFYACAKLKNVIIGSGVRTISNTYNGQGAFQNCTGITNIVFEADCHDIKLQGYSFEGKINELVLNGVIEVQVNAFSGMNVKKIVFDDCLEYLSGSVFKTKYPGNLSEVWFMGPPPSRGYSYEFYGKLDKKITTYVRHKYGDQWVKYSATGEINYKDTTFSADYVGEDYENRLLLWGDKLLSTTIIIK